LALPAAPAQGGLVLLSSLTSLALTVHRAPSPTVPSAWLTDSQLGCDLPWVARTGGAALHPNHALITPARLARWKAQVPHVHAWTVNDPARARELAALGVDCLITDNPGELRRALEGEPLPAR